MNNVIFSKRGASYGWVVVGASTLVMIGFYGTQLSFGVFLKPILEEFGWTRAMASGAMSTVAGIAGLVGILTGRLTDKYGARILIATGALLGGVGYLLMSQTSSLWQLYVYFGVIIGICIGSCWVPITATVSRWFVQKRVLALGITTSGLTIGQMFLPPLVAHFITCYGWRPTYIMLAIVVWIAAIPAVILLGRNPPQGTGGLHHGRNKRDSVDDEMVEPLPPREWSATEAAGTVPFWMLMVTGFVTAVGFYFMAVHIVAHATDIGIAITSAALILTFMGGGNIVGKLLVWPISTRIGSRFTLLLLLAFQTLALFLLVWATSLWMFLALGAVFGFGLGATTTLRMSMVSDFFGVRSVGTIIGLVSIAWAVGGVTAPILAGYVFDLSRSYDIAFLASGLLLITGMVATYFLKVRDG